MAGQVPYSNTTASARTESLYQNKMLTNYKVIADTPSRIVLGNRTANNDLDIVVLTSTSAPKGIIPPAELLVEYPARLKKASIATIASWTTVTEPASALKPQEDFPVCFSLQLRSSLSSTMDNTLLNELWKHFISSLQRTADGKIDFRSYLLGVTRPQADDVEPT